MKKKFILLVEDEPWIAAPVQAILHLSGYDTQISTDGRDAIEKARETKPDLILLDIMLPHLNGLDACKLMRQDAALKEVPVIVLTSLSEVRDTEEAFAAGANDFLSKPFDVDQLLAKIKKHLKD